MQRKRGRDIKNTWKNWNYQPSKVKLAHELWPSLEKKLIGAEASRLPVAEILSQAVDLAIRVRPIRELRIRPD